MATLNQERKTKVIYRFYLVAASLLIVFFSWGLAKEMMNRRQINQQISDYEAKIAKLKQENSGIEQKIASWNNSSDLEMAARTKLGLQKPGEKAIFINRGEDVVEPTVAIKTNQEIVRLIDEGGVSGEDVANPVKWFRRFF
ncbi:MAG: Cell division protein FtsL [Parcubacteria group bacterium ADurb.Bin326]|nr:MAG: Cell division protein FtsL [Parcubacteria group bacterium ADurb.Bin326]